MRVKRYVNGCFYIAQYRFSWTAQNALHFAPLAVRFIPKPTRLLWEAFSPRSNYERRQFTHISTTAYSQVLISTAEWSGASWRERKCPNSETVAKGVTELALSRLRVRHSTTELLRSKGSTIPVEPSEMTRASPLPLDPSGCCSSLAAVAARSASYRKRARSSVADGTAIEKISHGTGSKTNRLPLKYLGESFSNSVKKSN